MYAYTLFEVQCLPNKTIYIKDTDLPVWERAQKELGDSISSAFIDYLKERLERQRGLIWFEQWTRYWTRSMQRTV